MTYPRTVSAQLLDYDGSPVAGDPLDEAFGVNFYDEEDGPGRGGCSLSLSLAGAAELLPGRYVDCLVEGTPQFTFKIEGNPRYDVIMRGEEVDQIVTVQGRGSACIFDEAATQPEYALTFSLETQWRLFSFASPLFPNAGSWAAAVEEAEYLEGVPTAECYGHWQLADDGNPYPAPIGFPWPTNPFNLVNGVKQANYEDVWWIRTGDQPTYVSSGYWFFRNEFTLATLTPVTFDVTADNFLTFFLEGVPILGEKINKADHFLWRGWKPKIIWLPAGTYTVAGAVYNISFTQLGGGPKVQPPCPAEGYDGSARDDNPGGLMSAIYVEGDAVTPPTAILMTNDTWTSHYEELYWPGWTPGQIIDQLILEGVANGSLTVYGSSTYTDSDDSDSDPWRPYDVTFDRPDIPSIAFEVGTSLMQALAVMKEKGWIHWHVQPGLPLVLDVFRARLPSPPTSSATLAHGVNLGEFTRNATAPYANSLMVQWAGGIEIVKDTAAITAYGSEVRQPYASDVATADEAVLQGNNELAIRAQAAFPAIVVGIKPTSAADCPYEAFGVGDYVTVPAQGGGTEVVRCLSITCQQDPLGFAIWSTELNQKLDVPQRRSDQLLQQIGGRQQVLRGVLN